MELLNFVAAAPRRLTKTNFTHNLLTLNSTVSKLLKWWRYRYVKIVFLCKSQFLVINTYIPFIVR